MEKFNYKTKFGQNFLIDKNVLEKIISTVTPTSNDLILEIGPGSGNLTKNLKKYNCQIVAYEIDLETRKYLDVLLDKKTEIIFEDFLKSDVSKALKKYKYDNLYIIANLPYYITTVIIEKIIVSKLNPTKMILMVQKEVADRFAAKTHSRSYGYMTVYLNYYYKIQKLFNVPASAFMPSPKVESAVVEFTSHKSYNYKCEDKFIKLIKDAFKQKRKNLNNNLKSYDKGIIEPILNNNDLSLKSRAEEVPIEVFIEIANAL